MIFGWTYLFGQVNYNNRRLGFWCINLVRPIIPNDLIEQLLETCIQEFYMLSVQWTFRTTSTNMQLQLLIVWYSVYFLSGQNVLACLLVSFFLCLFHPYPWVMREHNLDYFKIYYFKFDCYLFYISSCF